MNIVSKDQLFINRARACAFTGHRILQKDFNKNALKELLKKVVEKDFNIFLVGMAIGFDTVCFQILEEIRKEKNIKIIACVPCKNQDVRFNLEQQIEYKRMLSVADSVVILSENYNSKCMQQRNEFMVDNASVVVAYKNRETGGTANTVKYAIKTGVPIIEVK